MSTRLHHRPGVLYVFLILKYLFKEQQNKKLNENNNLAKTRNIEVKNK